MDACQMFEPRKIAGLWCMAIFVALRVIPMGGIEE
jgi:hypothetical protein